MGIEDERLVTKSDVDRALISPEYVPMDAIEVSIKGSSETGHLAADSPRECEYCRCLLTAALQNTGTDG